MARGFLNVASIFKFYFKFSHRYTKHALIYLQFADSAGNIGAGTLIQTTLSFCTYFQKFSHFVTEIHKEKDCLM
jgi:hypothetical protein